MKIKLLSILNKVIDKIKLFKNKNSEEIYNSFELNILWDDIRSSTFSDDNNIIARAMKRNGFRGTTNSCMIILDNNISYIPEQLSDHWEAYNNSLKFKPVNIKYMKL